MVQVDTVALLAREVLRERAGALVAETCAWCVGMSDRPHVVRRGGRVVASGWTLGERAASGQRLGEEADTPLDVGDASPGTFRDALAALTPQGRAYAQSFEEEVVGPFVLDVCVRALDRARLTEHAAWAELLEDLGEDGSDPVEVVRAAEWEAPLHAEAQHLVLAAVGDVPLLEVEAEGLPLSVIRAAEEVTLAGATPAPAEPDAAEPDPDDLAGALFLAESALRAAGLALPVPPPHAAGALAALRAEDLEDEEVLRLLPRLPVEPETGARIRALLAG